jgi:dihydrofolate reductase
MRLNLIYARARNGVIGANNQLPWHLPEDLAHFKRLTLGHPVLMGRKTWESLPPRFRPLPGRVNAVLTRNENFNKNGIHRFNSLNSALLFFKDQPEVWVIGGAEIYALALPHAQRVVVTEIDLAVEGDAYAPTLGPQWQAQSRQTHVSASGVSFAFVTYVIESGHTAQSVEHL